MISWVSKHRNLALFVVLFACYAYFVQPPGANALSRYDLTRALVDNHSLTIDPYHENTIDKGYFNGHYYSDKPFGLSLLAGPAYFALRVLNGLGPDDAQDAQRVVYFLTLVVVGLPTALLGVLVSRVYAKITEKHAVWVGAIYGLGTIAFPFGTVFFGHQAATLLAFAAAALMISIRSADPKPTCRRSFAAGALAGIAALIEYPAALVGLALICWSTIYVRDRRHVMAVVSGIMPSVAALAGYNYLAYGEPFNVSYVFVNHPLFADAHRGLMGVSWPSPMVALQLLFSGKGLLVNAPVLLLAPLGFRRLWQANRLRPEAVLCAMVAISFLAYNAGYYLPFGGWTPGPRFLLPALPFLTLLVAAELNGRTRFRLVHVALITWGCLVMAIATATTPLVSDAKTFPLRDIWWPDLLSGNVTFNLGRWYLGLEGTASLIPLAAGIVLALIAIASADRNRRAHAFPTLVVAAPATAAILTIAGLALLPVTLPFSGSAISARPEPSFSVSVPVVMQDVVGLGQRQGVLVDIVNGEAPANNVALWLNVTDQDGNTTYEDWTYPLNFDPGESVEFRFEWIVPRGEAMGERSVVVYVLHWSWSYDLGHGSREQGFKVVDGR